MDFQYNKQYIRATRQELIDALKQRISPKRFEHVLRVEGEALQLAEQYGADKEAVSIAALMHDYAKDLPMSEMIPLATQYWDYPTLTQQNNQVLHGFAAAQICRETYGCNNGSILRAIAGHTIGWYEMDLIAKIIYIADYIEPGRDFPGVEEARRLSETDLDAAVWYKMQKTLQHLIAKKQPLFAGAIDIYNSWINQ